jgi:two-component system chemotaxis sensor kinase CheA
VAQTMSDAASYQLIFKNGFSTKEVVSEVSGRGVGMNVVEEMIHSLNGAIEIESEIGRGTRFRLKLPLTLAIFNGAVVRINDSRYVVPNSEIAEVGRIQSSEIVPIDKGALTIKIREELYELIDLPQVFKGGRAQRGAESKLLPVLLTNKERRKAFVVSEILGVQKIVQKQLGDEVASRPEFGAATILGDGSPGIILNLRAFGSAA